MSKELSKELKETNFQITGMTCAACAIRIEKGLKKKVHHKI
jgi:Cu+-exporting ATPase